jgi:LAS superfamily LD-carboxypeptidase LdcB
MSLDLDLDSRALSWMRANAGRYGFVEDVPREPWHWTFGGER